MGMIINNNVRYSGGFDSTGTGNRRYCTQAEYNAMPDSKYTDGVDYYITDGGIMGDAKDLDYDNSNSGLEATNVQGAIDEVNESFVGVNGKKIEFGTITIANGASNITFGEFASNPTVVAIARASGTPAFATCVVQSTTQARLYVWNAKTGELLNSSMTIDWVAVGDNK